MSRSMGCRNGKGLLSICTLALSSIYYAQGSSLTLESYLAKVDAVFPKLVATRLESNLAIAKAQEKRGAFDPVFSVENDFLRYNSSTTPGKIRQTSMTETTLEILDRTGVKIAFGARLNTGAVKQPGSSTGALGEYFVIAKIPLLRDRLNNAKTIAEKQALLGVPLAQQSIQEARLSLLQKAGEVYWDWVGAGEKLKIAKQVLTLAETRAEFIRRRVEAGSNPPIDIEEANAEVFRRLGSFEKSERDLQKAEFKLQFFTWSPEGEMATSPPPRNLLPSLPTVSMTSDVLAKQREEAQLNRPELLGIAISKDILALDVIQAQNDRKPVLDLTIGPGVDFGQDSIGLTTKAGIFYSIPLRQNTADGRIRLAQIKVDKLRLEEKQLRATIDLEVQDSASNLRQAYARFLAAQKEVIASQALEKGETIRFERGISTLFLINQRERSRAEAESRLIDVTVEHQQAQLAYLATSGSLSPEKISF